MLLWPRHRRRHPPPPRWTTFPHPLHSIADGSKYNVYMGHFVHFDGAATVWRPHFLMEPRKKTYNEIIPSHHIHGMMFVYAGIKKATHLIMWWAFWAKALTLTSQCWYFWFNSECYFYFMLICVFTLFFDHHYFLFFWTTENGIISKLIFVINFYAVLVDVDFFLENSLCIIQS